MWNTIVKTVGYLSALFYGSPDLRQGSQNNQLNKSELTSRGSALTNKGKALNNNSPTLATLINLNEGKINKYEIPNFNGQLSFNKIRQENVFQEVDENNPKINKKKNRKPTVTVQQIKEQQKLKKIKDEIKQKRQKREKQLEEMRKNSQLNKKFRNEFDKKWNKKK